MPGELALIAYIPFFLLLQREGDEGSSLRRGFTSGWYFGLGFFLSLLYWIALLVDSEIPVRGITAGGWVAMSIYLALYPGLATWATRAAGRSAPLWIMAPAAWGIVDYIRTCGILGFPWGSAGYALMDDLALVQIARFGGIHLVTFFVIFVNALLAVGIAALIKGERIRSIALLAAALVAVVGVKWEGTTAMGRPIRGSGAPFLVAVAQPNIQAEDKWSPEYRGKAVDILADLSRQAASEGARLIIWPETAVPSYVRQEFATLQKIVALAEEIETAILFGFPDADYRGAGSGYDYYNSAMLLAPNGKEAGAYRKIRLVPFGETIPGQERFEWIDRINLGQADFKAGSDFSALGVVGAGSFAPTICYEAIFPAFCRTMVISGAQYMVNLTNDAWFGTTAAPYQHASMARLRSVELGVCLARAANTGISLIADPHGAVEGSLPLGERGYVIAPITPTMPDTFYLRHGDWMVALEAILAAVLLLASAIGALLSRRQATH